jgi:hypothetical protein
MADECHVEGTATLEAARQDEEAAAAALLLLLLLATLLAPSEESLARSGSISESGDPSASPSYPATQLTSCGQSD